MSAPSFQRHREAVRERLLQSSHLRAGPGSVTWNVNREVIAVAGWGRAILLQLAHPAVAAGVHDHSCFRGSLRASLRRLRSTVDAMLAMTFGDTEQMIAAAARINTIHDRVRGSVRDGGRQPYSAQKRFSHCRDAARPKVSRIQPRRLCSWFPISSLFSASRGANSASNTTCWKR